MDIERLYGSERDLEEALLLEYVAERPGIRTALDVGAHYSWFTYAPKLRERIQVYHAIDLIPCEQTAAIVDQYIVGDLCEVPFEGHGYDLVVSISSIEHSGISTYKCDDWRNERRRVFKRCADLGRHLFCTFPFGAEMFIRDQYANVTDDDLCVFEQLVPGVESRFFFCEQVREPFVEISRSEAAEIRYLPDVGLRCVAAVSRDA